MEAIMKTNDENLEDVKAAESKAVARPELSVDRSKLTIIKAPGLGSVLPVEFYRGAGELSLDDRQKEIIAESQDCPDDEIDVRPEDPGLIYVRHIWYERKLNEIFGPGAWAMVPATDVRMEPETEKVYVMWVLQARGAGNDKACYVGSAIGWARLQPDNKRFNKSDAFEITRSDAVVKICAKTLGIGSNLWDKRFARRWRNENCVRVRVKTFRGIEEFWRRKDEDPFDGEVGATTPPQTQRPAPVETAPSPESPKKQAPAPAPEEKPAPKSEGTATQAEPPEPAGVPMAGQPQIRLFLARARIKGLITKDSAAEALKFITDGTGHSVEIPGKTGVENVIAALKQCTMKEFRTLITALDHLKDQNKKEEQ